MPRSTHTPGTRVVTEHADGTFNVYTDHKDWSLADETLIGYGFRNELDANLDAAAPELLEALKGITATSPDNYDAWDLRLAIAIRAIARAEGR